MGTRITKLKTILIRQRISSANCVILLFPLRVRLSFPLRLFFSAAGFSLCLHIQLNQTDIASSRVFLRAVGTKFYFHAFSLRLMYSNFSLFSIFIIPLHRCPAIVFHFPSSIHSRPRPINTLFGSSTNHDCVECTFVLSRQWAHKSSKCSIILIEFLGDSPVAPVRSFFIPFSFAFLSEQFTFLMLRPNRTGSSTKCRYFLFEIHDSLVCVRFHFVPLFSLRFLSISTNYK